MSHWKFSLEHVPGFLYLLDQIVTYDLPKEEGSIYKTIAAEGSLDKESIDERTIRRVFEFRKQLLGELPAAKRIPKPSLATLNVVTNYFFDGNPAVFMEFLKEHTEEAERYYSAIRPSEQRLNTIFKKVPDKIATLEQQVRQLEVLLADLKTNTVKTFTADATEEQLTKLGQLGKDDTLKNALERYIDKRIEASEKRVRRSALFYRFLGGFGLLFITTPQFSDLKRFVISAFLEDHEDGIDVTEDPEDDLEDDILDAAL